MSKRRYAKKSQNIQRNRMIVEKWRSTNMTSREIADLFNVSIGTVYNAIHRELEYGNPVYEIIERANEEGGFDYTQQVVTRAYVALKRWYDVSTVDDLVKQTFGTELDNSPPISVAVENLLSKAADIARNEVA